MSKENADTMVREVKTSHRNVAVLVLVILLLVGCLWGASIGAAVMWMMLR